MAILSYRSWALWMLGYPEAALADVDHALKDAREIGQAASLMYALFFVALSHIFCGDYSGGKRVSDELITLADEKGTMFWKALGRMNEGCVLALTGKASDAVQALTSGITAFRSTGATAFVPLHLSNIWRAPMPNSDNSMMLGAALTKR